MSTARPAGRRARRSGRPRRRRAGRAGRRRAGFARTIYQARQFVARQHVLVNGRRVDRPSYRLRPGDVVQTAERSRSREPFVVAAAGAHATSPAYLEVRLADRVARVERTPSREEVPVVCEEQLVVEHHSR